MLVSSPGAADLSIMALLYVDGIAAHSSSFILKREPSTVEEIFRQCGELYNKFVSFIEDMDKVEIALASAADAHKRAMYSLKDGSKKGHTIIGRFETIKRLEAKTNKSMPLRHLKEIELLPEDNSVIVLDTGSNDANTFADDAPA